MVEPDSKALLIAFLTMTERSRVLVPSPAGLPYKGLGEEVLRFSLELDGEIQLQRREQKQPIPTQRSASSQAKSAFTS